MIAPESLDLFEIATEPVKGSHFVTTLKIPTELPYFSGHFPGNPVLPGVAMIDFSLEALRVYTGLKEPLTSIRSAKYLGLIIPEDVVQLNCTKTSEKEWQVIWLKDTKKVCDLVLGFGA